MASAARFIFPCCGFGAALLNSFRAIAVALALLFNAIGNSFFKTYRFFAAIYFALRSKKFVIFLIGLAVLSLLGALATYETGPVLEAVDVQNECGGRPAAERVLKTALIPVRDVYRVVTGALNTLARYVNSVCFQLFLIDAGDWLEQNLQLIRYLQDPNRPSNTVSFIAGADFAFGAGDLILSTLEFFTFIYEFWECTLWAWTRPHPLGVVPVPTFQAENEFQAYHPIYRAGQEAFENVPPYVESPVPPPPPTVAETPFQLLAVSVLPNTYTSTNLQDFVDIFINDSAALGAFACFSSGQPFGCVPPLIDQADEEASPGVPLNATTRPQAYFDYLDSFLMAVYNTPGAGSNDPFPNDQSLPVTPKAVLWPITNETLPLSYQNILFPDFRNSPESELEDYIAHERATFGQRQWEFNPTYGAMDIFPESTFWQYIRRVVVSIQYIILELIRSFFLIIRFFRKASFRNVSESLVVSVNSSLSLWRILADNAARTFGYITIFLPEQLHCDGIDVPMTSRPRAALEYLIFSVARRLANLARAISLFILGLVTTRTPNEGSVPIYDFLGSFINSTDCGGSQCSADPSVACVNQGSCFDLFVNVTEEDVLLGKTRSLGITSEDPDFINANFNLGYCGISIGLASSYEILCDLDSATPCNLDTCRCANETLYDSPCVNYNFPSINVLQREYQFCRLYEGALASSGGVQEVLDCPLFPNHFDPAVGTCPLWDGVSFDTWTPEVRIPYIRLVLEALSDFVDIFDIFSQMIRILTCTFDNLATNPSLNFILQFTSQVGNRVRSIRDFAIQLVEIIQSFVYINFYVICTRFESANVGQSLLGLTRLFFFVLIDEFANQLIPIGYSIVTGIECSRRQDLFMCTLTQLSVIDNEIGLSGTFSTLCEAWNVVLDVEGLLDDIAGFFDDIGGFFGLKRQSEEPVVVPCTLDEALDAVKKYGRIQKKRDDHYASIGQTVLNPHGDDDADGDDFDVEAEYRGKAREKYRESEFFRRLKKNESVGAKRFLFSVYAADAVTFFEAAQKCYTGVYTVVEGEHGNGLELQQESEFSACQYMSRESLSEELSKRDEVCVASRCVQVAHECFEEHLRQNARTFMNSERKNLVADSWVVWPFLTAFRQITWLLEASSCSVADNVQLRKTITAANTALRGAISFTALAYHYVHEAIFVATYYAPAHFSCLWRVEKRYSEARDRSEVNVALDYIQCLEEPFIAKEELWQPAAGVSQRRSGLEVWQEYLHSEQRVENRQSSCYAVLNKYGVRFDNIDKQKSFMMEEFIYHYCHFAHAFGTRATLAASLATQAGGNNVGSVKIPYRFGAEMWRPLQAQRSIDDYLVLWKFPFAAMRSADFLTTPLFDMVNSALRSVSGRVASAYAKLAEHFSIEKAMHLFHEKATTSHLFNIRTTSHVIKSYAEIYRDYIEPHAMQKPGDRKREHVLSAQQIDALIGEKHRSMMRNVQKYFVLFAAQKMASSEYVKLIARRRRHSKRAVYDFEWKVGETRVHGGGERETYVGVDEEGYEVFEIDFGEAKKDFETRTHSADASARREATKQAYSKYGHPSIMWAVYGVGERKAASNMTLVPVDFNVKRANNRNHHIYVQARVDLHRESGGARNLSQAEWMFDPYRNIELQKLSKALRRFIDSSLDLNRARSVSRQELSEDLSDARFAVDLVDRMTGSMVTEHRELIVPATRAVFDPNAMQLAQDVAAGADFSEQRAAELRRAVTHYEPVSVNNMGRIVRAICRIVDRRVRIRDVPAVQNMAMILDFLGTNDVEMIAAYLSGSVRYIVGQGFVPRIVYESYMNAVAANREGLIVPYTNGVAYAERTMPFFMPSYSQLARGRSEYEKKRADHVRSMSASMSERLRRRTANRMYSSLAKHGYLDELFDHGDEHTWHEMQLIAPHLIDELMPQRGVNVSHVRYLMHATVYDDREEEDREHMRFAARIVARQTSSSATGLTALVDATVWLLSFVWDGVEDFFEDVVDFFLNSFEAVGLSLGNFVYTDVVFGFIDSLSCSQPDSYVLDGAAPFTLGCLLRGFSPERALDFIQVWPNDDNDGRIRWSDDAYASGSSECATGPQFQPSDFCELDEDDPDYITWYEAAATTKELCFVTRQSIEDSELAALMPVSTLVSRRLSTGEEVPDDDDEPPSTTVARECVELGLNSGTVERPFCPTCEYCVREYNNCDVAGYGVDPVRVVQVWYSMLDDAWDEITDIENDFLTLSVWLFLLYTLKIRKFIFANCYSCARFCCLIIFIGITAFGVLVNQSTFLAPAVFIFLLHLQSDGLAFAFYIYLLVRLAIASEISYFRTVFDDPTLSPDFLDFDLPPIFEWIADVFEEIGKLPCFVPYACVNPRSTLNENTATFIELEARFRIFESAPPTSFEQLCSLFGIWSVFVSTLLLIFLIGLLDIIIGVVFGVLGVGLGVAGLALLTAGYISGFAFVILLALASAAAGAFSGAEQRDDIQVQYDLDDVERRLGELERQADGPEDDSDDDDDYDDDDDDKDDDSQNEDGDDRYLARVRALLPAHSALRRRRPQQGSSETV